MFFNKKYSKAAIVSISVHLVAFSVLFIKFEAAHFDKPRTIKAKPVIQATTLNETDIMAEVARIKKQKTAEKQGELKELAKLRKAQQLAKKQLTDAEARKAEVEALKKKADAQRRLALKQQKELDAKRKSQEAMLKKLKQQIQDSERVKADRDLLSKKKAKELAALKAKNKKLAEEAAKLKKSTSKLNEEKQKLSKDLQKIKREHNEQDLLRQLDSEELSYMQDDVNRFAALINERISQHWLKPRGSKKGLACVVAVKLLPDGEIRNIKIVKSSGSKAFDRSTELAIKKSSPLPLPSNQAARRHFRNFTFTFKPEAATT